MNKLKLLTSFLLVLGFLFLPVQASDVIVTPNQSVNYWSTIIYAGEYFNVTGVNITIIDPNNTVVVNNQPATFYRVGQYYYNYTPQQIGNYFVKSDYYNETQVIAQGNGILTVIENIEEVLDMIFGSFLLLAIGILLTIVAVVIRNDYFHIAAGVWFLAVIPVVDFAIPYAFVEPMFLLVSGAVLIWHGISNIIENKRNNTPTL